MRRRKQLRSDSLELLLDTICNTFGGILFIAILVIIMLQMSSNSQVHKTADAAEIVEFQKLTTLLSQQNQELNRLQETLQSQEHTIEMMAASEASNLLAERTRESHRRDELIRLRDRLEQELRLSRSNRTKVEIDLLDVQRSLEQAHADVGALKRKLEEEKSERMTEMKTSTLRPSGSKSEVAVVLQYDRFYVWHNYDSYGNRRGVNTADFVILGENMLLIETTPNPVKGVAINESPESIKAIRHRLEGFRPAEKFLGVIVKPDSFDSFHVFRDTAIDLGFDYRLIPTESDSQIVDRGGTGGRVQ